MCRVYTIFSGLVLHCIIFFWLCFLKFLWSLGWSIPKVSKLSSTVIKSIKNNDLPASIKILFIDINLKFLTLIRFQLLNRQSSLVVTCTGNEQFNIVKIWMVLIGSFVLFISIFLSWHRDILNSFQVTNVMHSENLFESWIKLCPSWKYDSMKYLRLRLCYIRKFQVY